MRPATGYLSRASIRASARHISRIHASDELDIIEIQGSTICCLASKFVELDAQAVADVDHESAAPHLLPRLLTIVVFNGCELAFVVAHYIDSVPKEFHIQES